MPTERIGTGARQIGGGPVLYGRPDGSFGPKPGVPWTTIEGAANTMWDLAGGIEDEERSRYQGGLDTLTGAYEESRTALSSLVDEDLLYSKAADAVGARAKSSVEGLRRSLGARGLSANSGAAQGLLSRIAFEGQNSLIGAKRDIALENQRQRQVNAAVNFANALNLANYRNSPVGGQRLEATQGLMEYSLADRAVGAQERATKDAGRNQLLGAGIQGGLGLLSSLIPGI